jgi:hypothetical protein
VNGSVDPLGAVAVGGAAVVWLGDGVVVVGGVLFGGVNGVFGADGVVAGGEAGFDAGLGAEGVAGVVGVCVAADGVAGVCGVDGVDEVGGGVRTCAGCGYWSSAAETGSAARARPTGPATARTAAADASSQIRRTERRAASMRFDPDMMTRLPKVQKYIPNRAGRHCGGA